MNSAPIQILFSQAHNEQLIVPTAQEETNFSALRRMLGDELKYAVTSTTGTLTREQLSGVQVLVIGAPKTRDKLPSEEIQAVEEFLQAGSALLLLANAETMYYPPDGLNDLAALANVQFQEFHNYPITYLQVFYPHYVTAGVQRVKVGQIAALTVGENARCLARTKATELPVLACNRVGQGRMIVLGDTGLFADDVLAENDNAQLTRNIFRWLAAENALDIADLAMPDTAKWGQAATVMLTLHPCGGVQPSAVQARPKVRCRLESDADAQISDPARTRTLAPGKPSIFKWQVQPRMLGPQQLRLSIQVVGTFEKLYFDQLWPDLRCTAPGYFTLEVKNQDGGLQTQFQTGDEFTVEGAFHWDTGVEAQPCSLRLETSDGVFEHGHEAAYGLERWCWYLKAIEPGDHVLTLTLVESGQTFPAVVSVRRSPEEWLTEIYAAHVYPLDAEIAARLQQLDARFGEPALTHTSFNILSPDAFIKQVFHSQEALWLSGVLAAAQREQWHNTDLLNLLLANVAPTYLPGRGAFIPYAPDLASHLARLHPKARKSLEYNLLCTEESEDMAIKQNVAAYLLHEKYGHGFFYTQTRLGQQLTLLKSHPKSNPEVVQLLEDSGLIVNEGFAAWLELTALPMLGRDVRLAADLRRIVLIEQATGLYARERNSEFFREFSSRYDSRYREGYEYLEYIGRVFHIRCAVRLFLRATDIDLNISEDASGQLRFDATQIRQQLLDPAQCRRWHSRARLEAIADWLYDHEDEARSAMRSNQCLIKCPQGPCPLVDLVVSELQEERNDE
ncbi:MAG: hypothetical protein JW934_15605 [Anaerolineae bacterium]|nr:hypothetical protein [Anaerolineae bacterium]